MHYLLFYEVAEDYLARRAEFREPHLQKAWQAHERGELVLGGALADPVDGAVLLFKGDSPQVAEAFAKADPYVTNGLVKRWHVRQWGTVVGAAAATPVKPKGMAEKQIATAPGRSPILRMWKARTTGEKIDAYVQHATEKVFPSLWAIEGHRGACVLRRTAGAAIEIVVLTLWESMDAIRKFAGGNPGKAVVGPEARAVLTEFDDSVTHFEVAHWTLQGHTR
jgi:uncharacterized protein YciI/heme-degrading monooxygenase HmoA